MELPDFEDMKDIIDEILEFSLRKAELEIAIKVAEANVFKVTFNDERFLQNGKSPSVAFVENTYKFTGIDEEIIELRVELGEILARLDYKKNELDLMKTLVEVWRSEQANQRVAL